MRLVSVGVGLVVTLAACGGGGPTVSAYAEQAEGLVKVMEAGFSSLDADWEATAPTVEGAARYWDGRLAIRADFLAGVRALDVPDEVADLHAQALDVFDRITAADEALAARVATFDAVTEHWQWTDTVEGRAADAVLEEVFAFCRVSQDRFDDTGQDEGFGAGPWLSPQVEETVKVAFGCPPLTP